MTERHALPYVGTKVAVTVGDYTAYGVVEDYERHNLHQVTFPVKFGLKTRIMLASDVTELPDDQQPDGRHPPRWTGLDEQLRDLGPVVDGLLAGQLDAEGWTLGALVDQAQRKSHDE